MKSFYLILLAVVVTGCFAGYEAASRDLLQQAFLARKLTHRLAECLCVVLVLLNRCGSRGALMPQMLPGEEYAACDWLFFLPSAKNSFFPQCPIIAINSIIAR